MYSSTNVFLSQMASSKSQQSGNEDGGEGQVGLGSAVTLVVRAEWDHVAFLGGKCSENKFWSKAYVVTTFQ